MPPSPSTPDPSPPARPLRQVVWFTLFMLPVFALLLGLGTWQMQRLHWKEGLIAAIEARTKAAPVSVEEAVERSGKGEDIEYLRVAVTGRFDHAKERHLFALSDGEPGWHVITPLETEAGSVVIVDRGFVPNDRKEARTRANGQVQGQTEVVGLVRMPQEQAAFTPDNYPARNRWFWRDLEGISASIYGAGAPPKLAPFFLEAELREVPGGWPNGGQTNLDLPNSHLQYALTWFLLAGVLGLLYLYFVWRTFRPAQMPDRSGAP